MIRNTEQHTGMEMWGGIECTVNRVGDQWFDQVQRSGHDERPQDLERFAALGLRALRYPVLWERVAPISLDSPDFTRTDDQLARLRTLGLRSIIGLVHHGSGPTYTSLLDPGFPTLLARYARLVAERYPWVIDYTPVNEPLTTARFSGLYGFWSPHRQDASAFIQMLLTQVRGVVLAMQAIRAVNPAARLIQTEDCGETFGTTPTAEQVEHEAHRRWLTWDLLTGRVDRSHPLYDFLTSSGATERQLAFFWEHPCPPDVIGLNYYLTSDRYLDHRLERYPEHTHGGNGSFAYADVEAVRVYEHGIVGHQAHLLSAWRRYQLPVAVTEAHLSCSRDEQVRWLAEAWSGAVRAREEGADVRAVTTWALLGANDWDTLVTVARNRYEPGVFDIRSDPPRATRLASVIADLAGGCEPDHPVLDGPAWWRRSSRFIHGRTDDASPLPGGRQILITGAGTLGRAFQHLCHVRGLPVHLAERRELDIANSQDVDAAIRAIQPWAVINAAGYVRVDAAEADPVACHRTNVMGAVTLAAACRRTEIPFVTFSTDLVFDGTSPRPYVEDDAINPLNVYGASKAAAERCVLAISGDALIIRTSAFFGPWDDANFAAQVMRALARGEEFAADADIIVSPTYVPDLVMATLDLLIDGQQGVCHLASDGAVTWFEFAQKISAVFDLPRDRVVPAFGAANSGPARRPVNSALASTRGRIMRPLNEALAAFAQEAGNAQWLKGAPACASS